MSSRRCFYALIEIVVKRLKETEGIKEDPWLSTYRQRVSGSNFDGII